MRITQSTEKQLEVYDSAFWSRVLAIIFFLAGSAIGYLGWINWVAGGTLGDGPMWVPLFVGAMFIFGAGLVFAVGQSTIHRFDLQQGIVTVKARSLLRASQRQYSLSELADVVVEESISQNDDDTKTTAYRVAYLLRSGERICWTPYYTGTLKDKQECVNAVRQFLKLKDSNYQKNSSSVA